MKNSGDIRPSDRKIVETILVEHLPHKASVWIFGSRARQTAKKASDLDLLIDAGRELRYEEFIALDIAFEESDLPYNVDIVDLHAIRGHFLETVLRDRIPFIAHFS